MTSLLTIADLSIADIEHIFELADTPATPVFDPGPSLTAAYSFEGNSIRTRTTFLKALHALGIHAIEVPNFLKTREPVEHLAGYMDNWVDLYVLRESDHERLASFIRATRRPVINAMTSHAHPCEVLADAYSIRPVKRITHRSDLLHRRADHQRAQLLASTCRRVGSQPRSCNA